MVKPIPQIGALEETYARLKAFVLSCDANLRRNCSEHWEKTDIDLILAHYILGLVLSRFEHAAPAAQMKLFCHLAELVLPRNVVLALLQVVPPEEPAYIARAVEAAEQAGRCNGMTIGLYL